VKSLRKSPSGGESYSEKQSLVFQRLCGFSLIHYTRDGDRETGEYDRMSRRGGIGQENPRRKQKVMFLSALAHHAGQTLEFGFLDHPPVRQEPAGDEEESVE